MMTLRARRWLGWFLLLVASVAAIAAHQQLVGRVPRLPYLSGWVLLVLMVILTAYNGRKKIPFLPLIPSRVWLQFHIYAGLFSGVLFVLHISYRMPTGWFEMTLAALYALVMVSGIFGLFISRTIPQRLTTHGGEVLFERIPGIRSRLRGEVETLALQAIPEGSSATIADFYLRTLEPFFAGPRNVWRHLFENRAPLNSLLTRTTDLNRFLNQKERVILEKIIDLVRQKDGLDYHYSLQLLLKAWLFVHIPFTYSLLLFTIVHVILVFAFSGGAP